MSIEVFEIGDRIICDSPTYDGGVTEGDVYYILGIVDDMFIVNNNMGFSVKYFEKRFHLDMMYKRNIIIDDILE